MLKTGRRITAVRPPQSLCFIDLFSKLLFIDISSIRSLKISFSLSKKILKVSRLGFQPKISDDSIRQLALVEELQQTNMNLQFWGSLQIKGLRVF
jgi:hypothetical protein